MHLILVSKKVNNNYKHKADRIKIIICWSDEDKSYIADVSELPGCMADGKTYQEAISNAEIIINEWMETAMEFNDPIPTPKGHRLAFA